MLKLLNIVVVASAFVAGACASSTDEVGAEAESLSSGDERDHRADRREAKRLACAEHAEGDPCTVEGRRGPREGVCQPGRRGDELTCRSEGRGDRGDRHRGPPEAAVTVCASATAGTACEFEGRRGSRAGTCEAGPDGAPLACRSEHARGRDGEGRRGRRGRRGPPEEAIAACAEATEGASCQFDGRRGAVEGTCQTGRRVEGLVCRGARARNAEEAGPAD